MAYGFTEYLRTCGATGSSSVYQDFLKIVAKSLISWETQGVLSL